VRLHPAVKGPSGARRQGGQGCERRGAQERVRTQSQEVATGFLLNDQHGIPFVMLVTAGAQSRLAWGVGMECMIGMAHP
jgi:hypothetical protein